MVSFFAFLWSEYLNISCVWLFDLQAEQKVNSKTDVPLTPKPTLLAVTTTEETKKVKAVKSEAMNHSTIHVAADDDPSLMDSVQGRLEFMRNQSVSIVIIGASGDLAKKKTFPAIFSLFYHDLLPKNFNVYGYARSKMTQEAFREMIMGSLTCRVIDGKKCAAKMDEFLPRCHYVSGKYDVPEDFNILDEEIKKDFECHHSTANRLFYLAVPPSVFQTAATSIDACVRGTKGWTRVVVEKPFGRDLKSYRKLRNSLSQILSEEETYRIDHYLGKELVQNLMSLRFANAIFEPIWNRNYIQSVSTSVLCKAIRPPFSTPNHFVSDLTPTSWNFSTAIPSSFQVQIVFKENFGVEGRAGYFDNIGIIRDIMQNHLLQVLALVGMEVPVSLHAEDIRNEKVKLLRSIQKLEKEDFVVGQYEGKGQGHPGYLDDEGEYLCASQHTVRARWSPSLVV